MAQAPAAHAVALSQLLRKVARDMSDSLSRNALADFRQAVELTRSLLSQLQRRRDIAELPALATWNAACNDLVFDLLQLFKAWARSGSERIKTSLQDPRLRVVAERKNALLLAHIERLRGLLKSSDEVVEVADVSLLIADGEGRDWWQKHVGLEVYSVNWESFDTLLRASHGVNGFGPDCERLLRYCVDSAGTGRVTAHKFGAFLEGFGPGIESGLRKMKSVLSEGEAWFAGFLGREEAHEVLRGCGVGAFLVRFSSTVPCAFAVAWRVKGASKGVLHARIEASSSGGYHVEGDDQQHLSLAALVRANAETLVFPAPTLATISRASYFHGFISFDDACGLLQGKVAGSFLLRFSKSSPGSLVVAHVLREGEVEQSIIKSSKSGYLLGGEEFANLDELIEANRKKLKFAVEETRGNGMPLMLFHERAEEGVEGVSALQFPRVTSESYSSLRAAVEPPKVGGNGLEEVYAALLPFGEGKPR